MTDVFLMGTAGSYNDPKRSMWREPIKAECAKIGVTCYDPVVPTWDEETGRLEVEALHKARILVMAITDETPGMASLAESGWAVASALLRKQAVGLFIDPAYQGERTTLSTMMVRIDNLLNTNPSAESFADTSRRARKLVISHATSLLTQFPDTTLYMAKDLADLTRWTVATAKKLIVPHR
ncbi:MAG TPA: nucleoside 2-deoxyribosyltransferase domain-containing protein [Aggregatilineales bacterium]|nr:nucleoside 2-deoxyribosyltransferase domain-containing protein [Aggregatilineales bacterium]